MFWLVFLSTFFIDQLTKLLAGSYFEVVINQGISFSWFSRVPVIIINFVLLVSALVLFFVLKKEWQRHLVLSGLFWAGVVSNLVDRILLGGVTDWLPMPFFEITNNLADIVIGVALLGILIKEIKAHYGHQHNS
ncbi:signal peptidase II [Patescibacteria group bacterium]|nr:signal peptidase II [Patescibacteria group bacterium]MBU1885019.1 signal peptidase II [Patescibacteria group bacterium]